jgi:hypothetical protein
MRSLPAIDRTSKGVARHFREVFSEIVQGGQWSWSSGYDEEKG